ncbi:hypothetical protein F867_gp052 [Staphylococcus phage JD007]|uniref:Uncharacterized protein n=1 Tax=Staphylococcus phage JD007 TaxID=1239383 RepID=K7QMM9_9CAUD|nr:hypothetical protein F867_gp052 [Staphylococcus phage JD007]AFV50806.1 hypothetical protein [Staphylococcus phage JD007]BEU75412.1 hypothetical protein SNIID_0120 [Staphylococcus phage phiSNIID]VEV88410.1 hypothetical protein [Staphylococcus phage Stab21]VEV88820.1 hypothetical protein [Staphylococcus phage Stab21]
MNLTFEDKLEDLLKKVRSGEIEPIEYSQVNDEHPNGKTTCGVTFKFDIDTPTK